MIFRYMVENHAGNYLSETLQTAPSALKFLKAPHRWTKWIDLLHARVNELEVAGFAPTKFAVMRFIETATLAYADKQLDKARIKKPQI